MLGLFIICFRIWTLCQNHFHLNFSSITYSVTPILFFWNIPLCLSYICLLFAKNRFGNIGDFPVQYCQVRGDTL